MSGGTLSMNKQRSHRSFCSSGPSWRDRTLLFGLFLVGFAMWQPPIQVAFAAEPVNFDRQIRPIFKKRCHSCHGSKKQESGLRLDIRQDAMAGGDTGPAIVPGDTKSRLLLQYVESDDPELVMPPKGDRLSRQQIDLLKRWIDEGAKWPED